MITRLTPHFRVVFVCHFMDLMEPSNSLYKAPLKLTKSTKKMTTNEQNNKTLEVSSDSESEDEVVEFLLEEHEKKDAVKAKEEFKSFDDLSFDFKLEKLNSLVKQSQVFSNIISETLVESSLTKRKEREEQEQQSSSNATATTSTSDTDKDIKEPPRKRKSRKADKSKGQTNVLDFYAKKPVSEETKATKEKLEQTNTTGLIKQPSLVTGATMRDYQLEGAEWLITLYENGLNGILADEMGLGKTLQCIALMAFLYEQGVEGPFLVAAPLSTVGNWVNEIKRFAPALPVLGYVGLKDVRKDLRNDHFKRKSGFDKAVVVTSYEVLLRDTEYFGKVDWKFLIVDEGHRLKNFNCKLIRELKKLRTQNRLLLTGTPLQNNLNELWSLLNFILPDIFHDLDLFQKWFDFSSITDLKKGTDDSTKKLIDSKIQETLVTNLHTILKPFLLRRLKKTVLTNLVGKKEFIVYGILTEPQSVIYKGALFRTLRKEVIKFAMRERIQVLNETGISSKDVENFLSNEIDGDKYEKRTLVQEEMFYRNLKKRDFSSVRELDTKKEKRLYEILVDNIDHIFQKKMANLVMQLRLICDSPYLFYYPWDNEEDMTLEKLLQTSAKLQLLDQLVPKLVKEGHKVLIFSQFTNMMSFIQDWCDLRGYDHCYLAGDSSQEEREENINKFNNDKDSKVFILSTRAGGLGLNLIAADSVILFDSDWNPQVDLQAMDRVHRIGQTSPVAVYRFVVANSVEELILAKSDAKRKLEKLVIQMGKFQSLERLINQDGHMMGGSTNKKDQEVNLAKELAALLEDNVLQEKEHNIKDNKLSKKELEVLCDRSPESYTRSPDYYAQFPHIQLFETATSFS